MASMLRALISPSVAELYWAAGFLEGEGAFFCSNAKQVCITAAQVQREPLDKLLRWFGGCISEKPPRGLGKQLVYRWAVYGKRAASVAMTLFDLMSTRRRAQIARAMAQWRSIPCSRIFRHVCAKGHSLSGDNLILSPPKQHRRCRTCQNAWSRQAHHRRKALLTERAGRQVNSWGWRGVVRFRAGGFRAKCTRDNRVRQKAGARTPRMAALFYNDLAYEMYGASFSHFNRVFGNEEATA